jgi:hypothetical protein
LDSKRTTGIGHQDFRVPQGLGEIFKQALNIFSPADIRPETHDLGICALDNFLGGLLGGCFITGADCNPAFFSRQLLRASPAQAPACRSDQGDFPIYSKVHSVPLLLRLIVI